MNCLRCGEDCHCVVEEVVVSTPRWIHDTGDSTAPVNVGCEVEVQELTDTVVGARTNPEPDQDSSPPASELDTAWRNELSARLTRYRARRKPQPPRYPSLRLRFDAGERNDTGNPVAHTDAQPVSTFSTNSFQALALDGTTGMPLADVVETAPETSDVVELPPGYDAPEIPIAHTGASHSPAPHTGAPHPTAPHFGAKIIEFPRFYGEMPPVTGDELAEPVLERPRILEVPETAPPPPALGGITIETTQQKVAEKRAGIDFPLHNASLSRRIAASLVDFIITALASALFVFIFWKVTGFRPPLIQLAVGCAALLCLLWAAYQYLLLVYSASTPGLRLARLQLMRFDGAVPPRHLRRWRVLASYLSAASLGMGYVWVFLDESTLCWHDRITRTHLAPKAHKSPSLPSDGR